MSINLAYTLSAANATEGLAQVQSGWARTFWDSLPTEYVWFFVGGLVLIIAFAAIFYVYRQKHHKGLYNWSTIVEPYNISAVLNRAADRNANFSLEVFHPDHAHLYKGQVHNLDEGRLIYLNLSEAPPPDLNFVNETAQIHLIFRPSLKQAMEHYQFVSNIQSSDSIKEKGWRTTILSLNWPKSIIQTQRRNYLRLEPPLEKSLSCHIYNYVDGNLDKLDNHISSGRVLDISIGGVQILFEGIFSCAPGQLFIASLTLGIQGLELPAVHEDIHLVVPLEILSTDKVSSPLDHDKKMNTVVRTKFLGRFLKTEEGLWRPQPFKALSFQDLAYWLQACYRLNLQKEHGLLPPTHFDRPANRFPPSPPERPPLKYD